LWVVMYLPRVWFIHHIEGSVSRPLYPSFDTTSIFDIRGLDFDSRLADPAARSG
jgi:hypothetical protein